MAHKVRPLYVSPFYISKFKEIFPYGTTCFSGVYKWRAAHPDILQPYAVHTAVARLTCCVGVHYIAPKETYVTTSRITATCTQLYKYIFFWHACVARRADTHIARLRNTTGASRCTLVYGPSYVAETMKGGSTVLIQDLVFLQTKVTNT